MTMGDLSDYNRRINGLKKFQNKTIMINGLLKVHNMKKEMLKKIVKKMPTYRMLYQKLLRLKN